MNRKQLGGALVLLLAGCTGYGYGPMGDMHEHKDMPMSGMHDSKDMPMMHQGGMMPANGMFRGGMLVAHNGMTLYSFDKDQPGSGKSSCEGPCSMKWPPYLAPAMARAQGDYGIITRSDGARQWTFRGWPLYFWQGDQKAGDAMGDNIGMVWHVIKP